jgi:hypothetical protein
VLIFVTQFVRWRSAGTAVSPRAVRGSGLALTFVANWQTASTGPERNPALPLGPTLGRISTPDQAEHRLSRDFVPNHFEPYGKPVFGPATRALPQLHIDVNDEGCFYVKCDFIEPVGPAFWEWRS